MWPCLAVLLQSRRLTQLRQESNAWGDFPLTSLECRFRKPTETRYVRALLKSTKDAHGCFDTYGDLSADRSPMESCLLIKSPSERTTSSAWRFQKVLWGNHEYETVTLAWCNKQRQLTQSLQTTDFSWKWSTSSVQRFRYPCKHHAQYYENDKALQSTEMNGIHEDSLSADNQPIWDGSVPVNSFSERMNSTDAYRFQIEHRTTVYKIIVF